MGVWDMELSSSILPKWLCNAPSNSRHSPRRPGNLKMLCTRFELATSPSQHFPQTAKSHLVLMRHGESMWNDLKLFTGDVDIPLTEKGIMEALASGRAVSDIDFDIIFTSRLVRAKQTALIAMTQNRFKRVPVIVRGGFHGRGKTGDANRLRLRDAAAKALKHASCHMVPVYADPALNERSYGDLQGLSKEAAIKEFGEETVSKWRRSYDTKPPHGESLKDTALRSVRFFKSTVVPRLEEHRNVLVVAHGNVLRCIIAHLSGLSDMEMLQLQVFTALPYAYTFDGGTFSEGCTLPPLDPNTESPREDIPLGISSVFTSGDINSLI
uniref:phosphoglycerate mutase (2,3-diphosphoglycerate-dependent) n=1 Tax=Araucaria cunninghamii TaxID=56994 RepID=A0A0D6R9U6_ARACU